MGADDLVAVRDSAGTKYYVATDHVGSIRGVSREDGVWQASYRYRSYGQALDSAGSVPFVMRYRWLGREFDPETGFYYLRARYHNPRTQQFTQEDPIGYAGGRNVYAYGDGNPTNGRDLDGLSKEAIPWGAAWTLEIMGCMDTLNGCSHGANSGDYLIEFAWALGQDIHEEAEIDVWKANAQGAQSGYQMSKRGLNTLEGFEGYVSTAYNDVTRHPTIGIGHLIRPGERFAGTLLPNQVYKLFAMDVARVIQPGLDRLCPGLNQGQVDAWGWFFFNAGPNGRAISAFNAGRIGQLTSMFANNFSRSSGIFIPELYGRRMLELQIIIGGPVVPPWAH